MLARTALTLTVVACAQACFFLDLACQAKQAADAAADHLTGDARVAFEQAMDHLFDDDIGPMIDKAQAAIDASADKVAAEVNATVDHITASIKSIINDAAQTASALAKNISKDVEQIIADGSEAVQKAEQTFFNDANKLLNQLNEIVQKGQCMEAGAAKQIQDQIYKLLKELNPLYHFSSCWRGLGYKVTQTLEDLTDMELYNYQKECALLNKITPTTPIEGPNGILQIYAQGQLYSAEYYCIGETAGSPAFQDVFTKEWVWWGVQYNSWKQVVTPSSGQHDREKKNKQTEHSNHRATGNMLAKRVTDNPCGTPVECYAQAIKKLNDAEQKIAPLEAALEELNNTKPDKTELNAVKTDLETDIMANRTDLQKEVESAQVESTMCRDLSTDFQDAGKDAYSYQTVLVFLDRHDVKCGDNEQLTRWHVNSGGNFVIQVQYTCCQAKITMQGADQAILV